MTEEKTQFKLIEWQTWPWDGEQPSLAFASGIVEEETFENLVEILEFFGYTVVSREIYVDL